MTQALRERQAGGRTERPWMPTAPVIVNFGCGPCALDGYRNIDGSPTVLFARIPIPSALFGRRAGLVEAIRKGRVIYGTSARLKLPAASLDAFYASHVLEHLSRRECHDFLVRVRSWLKPNGFLRIALPDLRLFADCYSKGEIAADRFVEFTNLSTDGLTIWQFLFGHSHHRWMYDVDSARSLLASAGYRSITHMKCGESALSKLATLDHAANRKSESFYLEASK